MSLIPVTVLTGFLGSGKTTLLNALLGRPELADTAVLINEYGEASLDHLLVRKIDDAVVQLASGCVCCSIRGELVHTLRDLFLKRVRGEVPEFQRLVVETTGLADPAPVVHTLIKDPMAGSHYALDGIVATVDAVLGMGQLDSHPESVKQAAMADRLVLTKTDLADAAAIAALRTRLAAINPGAPVLTAVSGDLDPAAILDAGADPAAWLQAGAVEHHHHGDAHEHEHAHERDDGIRSFTLEWDGAVPAEAFERWLNVLLAARGEDILRLKGLVRFAGEARPMVVHGVQHLVHPPQPLPEGVTDDGPSRLVFITRGMAREDVADGLRQVLAGE